MESAVSIAFSKLHVTMMEKILTAFPTLWNTLPFFVSLPMHACASETTCICALNFGMKRSAMGRRIRSLDSFDSTCYRLCACHMAQYDYFRFPELYRDITAGEIQEFLARVVLPQRCSLSVVEPLEEE